MSSTSCRPSTPPGDAAASWAGGGAVLPEHVDVHYYWRTHFRVHIPVITNPGVAFTCAGETVHMEAGECWLLNSFYSHSVANRGDETRVHLVLDTVGSGPFWDMIEASLRGASEERFIAGGEAEPRPVAFEQVNAPLVMSPWEMKTHVAYVSEWTDEQPGRTEILKIVDRFVMAWEGAWTRYGLTDEGLPVYANLLNEVQRALAGSGGPRILMRNAVPLRTAINGLHPRKRSCSANGRAAPGELPPTTFGPHDRLM